MTLANVLLRAGQAEEAKSIYEELAERSPKDVGPNHTGLAIACSILGDYEQALEHAEEWEMWSPGNYSASLVQANALALLGDVEAARSAIEKIQETMPSFQLEQGIASLQRGNTEAAVERITAGLVMLLETQRSTD